MTDTDSINDTPMPLLEHLVELRKRLIWSIVTFVIAFAICYHFSARFTAFWRPRSATSCVRTANSRT